MTDIAPVRGRVQMAPIFSRLGVALFIVLMELAPRCGVAASLHILPPAT